MSPKTPKSTISRKAWQKLSPEWYSKRAVLIGWVGNSLDAFVAPCYSRNRTFWGIWWRIQRIYCNIKVLSLKNGSSKCAWGRNNWTVQEWGFRSCHCLRSFSGMRVFGGAELSLKINDIFLLLFWQSAVIDNTLQIPGDQRAACRVLLEENCYRSVFASFAFVRQGGFVVARSQLILSLFSLTR